MFIEKVFSLFAVTPEKNDFFGNNINSTKKPTFVASPIFPNPEIRDKIIGEIKAINKGELSKDKPETIIYKK